MKEKYRAFKEWKKDPRHKALYQLLCWFAFFGIVYLVAISGLFRADYVPKTDSSKVSKDSLENYLNMEIYEYEYSILHDANTIKITGIISEGKNYFEFNSNRYYVDGVTYLVDEVNKKLVAQENINLPINLKEISPEAIHKWITEGSKHETIEYKDGSKKITYLYSKEGYEIKIVTNESKNMINSLEIDLTNLLLSRGEQLQTFIVNIKYDNINNISSYDRYYDDYERIELKDLTNGVEEQNPNIYNEEV